MNSDKKKKICRVCGASYSPCNTCERDKTRFHWREVACSMDCGRIYLAWIMESRAVRSPDPEAPGAAKISPTPESDL